MKECHFVEAKNSSSCTFLWEDGIDEESECNGACWPNTAITNKTECLEEHSCSIECQNCTTKDSCEENGKNAL